MASRKMSYNLPGLGNLTANLFEYTQTLFDFLDYYGHIQRFRRINQLGRLRDVFQGAHHNRFEYVFLQLALISELCQHKRGDIGLSGTRSFCGRINAFQNDPSLGEILQCLVLVNNMGYMEGTFLTSRAWITFLKEDTNARKCFRSGLDSSDRSIFDEVIANYDYYRFHLIVALFQLQRYKRKGADIVNFASNLLRNFLKDNRSDLQIIQLKNLYNSIRQISFITLDSMYAPVPFNLDLSSIFLNFDYLLDSLFIKNTTYRVAFYNLEQVLQNAVYLNSDSCINTARASEEKLHDLREIKGDIKSLKSIFNLVCPTCNTDTLNHEITELEWVKERKILQEYRIRSRDLEQWPDILIDELKWEIETRQKVGQTRARVGLLMNSRKNMIKLAFGLTVLDNKQSLKAALKITTECVKFGRIMPEIYWNRRSNNQEELIIFLCKSIFGWDKRFILNNKHRLKSAIIIENGRANTLQRIQEYLGESHRYLTHDEIFEVEKIKVFIERLKYAGLTITFVGGLKVFEQRENQESAEFDGLVVCPSLGIDQNFAHIIEAKNYNNGVSDATRQLNNRVSVHLIPELQMNIVQLDNRAAYAEITAHNNA